MRLVGVSDLHSGHYCGITPPRWQDYGFQRSFWNWYVAKAKKLKPDVIIDLGDNIDGRGERSGGTELITTDRNEQVLMAYESLIQFGAKRIIMVRGTPYHTGDKEDFEDTLCNMLNKNGIKAEIYDHAWVKIGGLIFDLKHKVGGSSVPQGRFTSVAREALWNLIWSAAGEQTRADWIVRGHVHYCTGSYAYIGQRRIEGLTMPCLQVAGPDFGTKFGARQCSGSIDVGVVSWDLDGRGGCVCNVHRMQTKQQKAKTIHV
jgi:hypothetical protein